MRPPSEPAEGVPPADVLPAPAGRGVNLYWWLSASVLAIDQITKALIVQRLPKDESVAVIPGFMDFTHVRNAGVAFGLLNDPDSFFAAHKWVVTTALAVMALLGIGLYARHIRRDEWVARVGLSLILGGAAGNLVDRVHFHNVVDFVDVYFGGWHFWAFNVADASITIGAVLVFFDLLFVTQGKPHASDSV